MKRKFIYCDHYPKIQIINSSNIELLTLNSLVKKIEFNTQFRKVKKVDDILSIEM
jgi:hypothetical protein